MFTVSKPRQIIDRATLLQRLADKLDDTAPGEQQAVILAELKTAMARGDEEVRRRLQDRQSGPIVAAARCYLIDQIIRVLFETTVDYIYPLTNPTKSEHISLVAVGGYGRGELAPYSDVDLLFLLPYKQTPWGEQVVESMLYVLWDLGLKVGYSVRTTDDCIRLAQGDQTIKTAMLDMRFLWGDRGLFNELRRRYDKEVVAGNGPDFIEAKLAERDDRHKRMGDSRYVVEPNLKDGKGGLRDLHTLFWIGKFVYQVDDPADLVDKGVLTKTEYERFRKAETFLWTVRCHLHDLVGRPEERLTFDVQKQLSERLHYRDRSGSSGVERFMKHYFLVAKDVGDLTRIFCAHLEEQNQRKTVLRLPRLGLRRRNVDGFVVDGGRLTVETGTVFAKQPMDMLRLFAVAQEHDYDIHPAALRHITRHLKYIDAKLRKDPDANTIFLQILTSPNDPATTLRRMNEAGVLGKFIEDFGRVVAQMQHDMYHHYTVDEHTIRAIDILWRIETGNLAEDHPLSVEVIKKVLSRRVLYVAVLLHDIAKGRGGDHSVLGAEVAEKLCPRLGLTDAETETVAWLVRHHLLMSNVAFKRDVSDPKTVSDFAAEVQSPERLRLLVVLTVADIRAVGPGVYNGWKGQLLRDLYYSTEDFLTGGQTGASLPARVQRVKEELAARLPGWTAEDFTAYADQHYEPYWISVPLHALERDAKLVKQARADKQAFAWDSHVDEFRAVTELTFYTQDHPGLFARISGAMGVAGVEIVDAKIFTTKDGMALDHFSIQDLNQEAITSQKSIARIAETVSRTLKGDILPRKELAKPAAIPSRTRKVFTVAPVVLIDNNASNMATVIEVNGRDRPGLLHDITRALFDLKLSISSAHIATFGERAVDVFYVRDLFGHKVTHEDRLRAIEERLREALTDPLHKQAEKSPAAAE